MNAIYKLRLPGRTKRSKPTGNMCNTSLHLRRWNRLLYPDEPQTRQLSTETIENRIKTLIFKIVSYIRQHFELNWAPVAKKDPFFSHKNRKWIMRFFVVKI